MNTDIKLQRCNENHIIKIYKGIDYDEYDLLKPFWFGKHMYFVNIKTGILESERPIYLGDKAYATISNLRNYFKNNDIEIMFYDDVIK